MATDHVTPIDTAAAKPPLYTFSLAAEVRKLAAHVKDVIEMLREDQARAKDPAAVEQAARNLVGAIAAHLT